MRKIRPSVEVFPKASVGPASHGRSSNLPARGFSRTSSRTGPQASALSEIGVDFQKDGSAREITKNRARFLHPKPACHSERCRQPASPGLPATMHPRPFQFQRGLICLILTAKGIAHKSGRTDYEHEHEQELELIGF